MALQPWKWIPTCLFLFLFLLLLLLTSLEFAVSIDDGLLENGDFERAPLGGFPSLSGSGGIVEEEGTESISIPGWTTNGTVELVRSGQKQGGMILVVPQGKHAVRLGNDAEIAQEVRDLEKGSVYSITFSAARTCAQLESLNVSVATDPSSSSHPSSGTVDLQTLYTVEGWDAYAWAFQAMGDSGRVVFSNPGMEDDPTCGPILDNIAIKKLFTPDKARENAVINGDFEEGPWMYPNATLGILLPTNLDDETTSLPGWIVESNRAVRFIDSYHFNVPQGKRAVELLSGKEGIIAQMVETTPEKQYSLTFLVGSAGDSCQEPLAVMAFAGDQAQNFHLALTGNNTHQPANLSFIAKAESTRVAFYSIYYNTRTDDRSSLCGPVIDDVKVWSISCSTELLTTKKLGAFMAFGLLLILF